MCALMRTPNHLKREPATQAERITARFGGPLGLAKAIGYTDAAVYKWNYTKDKGGCNGLIPTRAMDRILSVARMFGVLLTIDDLKPRTL